MSHRVAQVAQHIGAGKGSKQPLRVVVTGAAGNIAYSIIFMIGQGRLLGADQPISLRLLDIPPMADKLKGVAMEVSDCAFPLFTEVVATTDYAEAFDAADICLLIGAKPRSKGEERSALLKANAGIFAGQGRAINQYASRNVKVLVVGNPANTNALIAMTNAPDIPRENFTAMTRLDQNRAMSQLSGRTGVHVSDVRNVIIWGNHSSTQYPDVYHATIAGKPVYEVVGDDAWIQNAFLTTVQKRGAAIIEARGLSSAASAANAAVDHIRSWFLGTAQGEYVSMGVVSDGSYGVPEGLIYSFPCTCRPGGNYEIVRGLPINDFSRQKMDATAKELLEEKEAALSA